MERRINEMRSKRMTLKGKERQKFGRIRAAVAVAAVALEGRSLGGDFIDYSLR